MNTPRFVVIENLGFSTSDRLYRWWYFAYFVIEEWWSDTGTCSDIFSSFRGISLCLWGYLRLLIGGGGEKLLLCKAAKAYSYLSSSSCSALSIIDRHHTLAASFCSVEVLRPASPHRAGPGSTNFVHTDATLYSTVARSHNHFYSACSMCSNVVYPVWEWNSSFAIR